MGLTPISSDGFVRQILQSTVTNQMETDKKRLVALIQIKAQQDTVEQKTQSTQGALDVYA